MARPRPRPAEKPRPIEYAGDPTFAAQMKDLDVAETVESMRRRIADAVQARRRISPTQLLGEIVGPEKQNEENPEDPELTQAFAMNFLALWNEEVARLPRGEETTRWRAEVQERIEEEAQELRKPYLAPARPGRNDPCACGSGKKFKRCCGA